MGMYQAIQPTASTPARLDGATKTPASIAKRPIRLTPPPLPTPQSETTGERKLSLSERLKQRPKRTQQQPQTPPATDETALAAKLAFAIATKPKRGRHIGRLLDAPAEPQPPIQPKQLTNGLNRGASSSVPEYGGADGPEELQAPCKIQSPDWLLNARRKRRRSKFRNASSWLLAIAATIAITGAAALALIGGPGNLEQLAKAVALLPLP